MCDPLGGTCNFYPGNTGSFKIHFTAAGCNSATIDSFTLNSMTTTVGDTPGATQAIPTLSTDVETANASLDCGDRKYTLASLDTPAVDLTPFLSIVTSPTLQIRLVSS